MPRGIGVGAVPFGVHDGEAVCDRHTPLTQAVNEAFSAEQSVLAAHPGKQNEPVDVLTHVLPNGQVLWSAGLQAAVHAPPGNSGPVPQISPAPVHGIAALQAFPRSALAGRPCAGQFAAGTQAPSPVQHV